MRRAILAALALAACARAPEPEAAPNPRYMLGEPVRLGGLWAYPREEFARVEQGVAEMLRLPEPPRLSVSGEVLRVGDLIAAHPTLQLPAIVAVTNLETGRTLRLRVIERGPDRAGRVLAVSPRAAALLGAGEAPFQARVEVDGEASRAAIAGLPGRPEEPRLAPAPVGRISREALPPPPGTRGSAGLILPVVATPAAAPPPRFEPLTESVILGPARTGRLLLEASTFFRRDLALRQAALLPGGRAEPAGPPGRQQPWRAVAGPFAAIAEADAALASALRAGLAELRLVVE